ncbi:MAG: hypothetical protein KGD58_17620 [Candidatus Lokiarchaeota archaeon]|nr:hypothetical protein [Candidatus Lokiarchaeota archaeon]
MEISKLLSIMSTVLCFIGGVIFLIFGITFSDPANDRFGPLLIVIGIFVIIGAIARLKYTRRGSILCLALGIIGLLMAWLLELSAIYGTIFTLLGSVVGFIGVMKE